MIRESLLALRERAAKPVIERLREHREEIEELERVLFDQLEARLFEPELTAKVWRQECRQTSGWAVDMIEETVGTSLALYLEELRVETAMHLFALVGDDVPSAEVGQAVGYRHAGAFGRAFARHCYEPPASYRQMLAELRARGTEPPDPSWIRNRLLKTITEGRRELEKLLAAVDAIEEGLQSGRPVTAEERETLRRAKMLDRLAERVLPIFMVPLEQALQEAVLGARPETPALCDHLFEQSQLIGSENPEMGVRIAELAIRHAYGLKPRLGVSEYAHLIARAWAWLGEARRQASDEAGAAEAFLHAEEALAEYPAPPAVITEVFALKSALGLPAELDDTPARWRPN